MSSDARRKVPCELEFQEEVFVITRDWVINEIPQEDGSLDVILESGAQNTDDPQLVAIVPAFGLGT